ncbi:hypothetical protein CHS0354_031668 [Potamilus streckersoni]|uniref:Major facilitator superfamily (MFS) profile domain-containing protein n=1 Tax=Potamilus streckersoni TaxID=2493646 RepID=A0AAE0TG75_9BIVA|nr:hypothetical protein CHS0354_031668 [Potamilus streckersoni]
MSQNFPPFDDTVQLEIMPVDFSDESPIIQSADYNSDEDMLPPVVMRTGNQDEEIGKRKGYFIIAVLFFINLLNYMDRFTIAGVLKDIQNFYDIENREDGLLQTIFIASYMVFSPIFGYLGDRYVRKFIMTGGILFWTVVTFAGSFVPKEYFYIFLILRGLVGVGEASYSTIAPTIIADLFAKEQRTRMLMIFYFAIPVGSGLGYIVGSNVAKLFGQWQYALRVTPILGLICVAMIIFIVKEPKRGMSEGGTNLHHTSFLTDLKELVKNKSFIFSTLGFTCVAFVTGALALWAALFMQDSISIQGSKPDQASVSLLFGVITVIAGFVGVALGAEGSRRLKQYNPRADPLICAFGMLSCTPFLFFALVFSEHNTAATWALIFIGETFLCLNWSIVADILLYVVIPTRRSTAEAFQILTSHALGDAGSPYLIGQVADLLSSNFKGDPQSPQVQFYTLQLALYITPFICVLGGAFFLATALFIEDDKEKANKLTQGIVDAVESLPERGIDGIPILFRVQ